MTVSRPSSLDFWPNDVVGKELLSQLRTYAQEFRAIFGSIGTIPDRVKSLWQKPDENKKDISDMTSYLKLVQKIPDYIEEVVDLSTEYVISVHGSGIEMEDDGKLHHAYSISSRQLAVQLSNALDNLKNQITLSYNYGIFAGKFGDARELMKRIVNNLDYQHDSKIKEGFIIDMHHGAAAQFYRKEQKKPFSHCIQQIASATSFSRWVNNHNKSAKKNSTELIKFVNFFLDAESDEQSRKAFAGWMLDPQTSAKEIAALNVECKKFLTIIMGIKIRDLDKNKTLALMQGDISDLSINNAQGDIEKEIVSQLHSPLSKQMYETMNRGETLDPMYKNFLDTTAEREKLDGFDKRLWETYKNTGMLRALAQNAKLDLADFFDSVTSELPWAYLTDPSVLKPWPASQCYSEYDAEFGISSRAEEIIKNTNATLEDIITDKYNKELDHKLIHYNDEWRQKRMTKIFKLLTDEKRRAVFKRQFACVMIKNEAEKLMQQAASGLKNQYDYYRLIATMISFFSPIREQAGELACRYIHSIMGKSLQNSKLGNLIHKVSEGQASMSLRGGRIRVVDDYFYDLPLKDEEEE